MAHQPSPEQPIGVFDSGVGGLTVLHELLVDLPHENYLYLGDAARFPYGTRTRAELIEISIDNTETLLERGAKLIVIACNSATATALDAVRAHLAARQHPVPVLGVVLPESIQAAEATHNGRVGLLATPATVAAGAYDQAIAKIDDLVSLTSVECPDLASLIQDDAPITDAVLSTVRRYCQPLIAARVDTVILGCTHYPMVQPMLQRVLGRDVRLITSGQAIVRRVEQTLALRGIQSTESGEGTYRFLVTADPESFAELGSRFLQLPVGDIELIRTTVPAAR